MCVGGQLNYGHWHGNLSMATSEDHWSFEGFCALVQVVSSILRQECRHVNINSIHRLKSEPVQQILV